MTQLASDQVLTQQVTRYHNERIAKWTRIILAVPALLLCILTTLYCTTRYQYSRACTRYQQLTEQHRSLAQEWGASQKTAKRLKTLTKEYNLLRTQLPKYLTAISQSIGDTTLLVSLSYKNDGLGLKGYADSTQELAHFMMKLFI